MAKKRKAAAGNKGRVLSEQEVERLTKAAAKKRRITVELTEDQVRAFTKQYERLNPSEAAELVFTLGKRTLSKLKVAGYSYHGDTCCV